MEEAAKLDSYLPFSFRSATVFCVQNRGRSPATHTPNTCPDSRVRAVQPFNNDIFI